MASGLVLLAPLPASIVVTATALDVTVPARIADRPVSVHLPTSRADEPVLYRPTKLDWAEPEPTYTDGMSPDEDDREESPWGFATSWGNGPGDETYAVSQLVVAIADVDATEVEATMRAVIASFPVWFDTLKDWCEVVARQDLDHLSPRRRVRVEGSGWRGWYGDQPCWVHGRMRFDFDYGEPLTKERWARFVTLADAGGRPAIEHLLARDARGAHARQLFRRAVVDSATSLEIGLYRLLLEEHRKAPSPLADRYVEQSDRWGLGTMIQNVGGLTALPASVSTNLAWVRNKVVHRSAQAPTPEESSLMLQAVDDLLVLASPLPTDL